jgi:hypothetical protein
MPAPQAKLLTAITAFALGAAVGALAGTLVTLRAPSTTERAPLPLAPERGSTELEAAVAALREAEAELQRAVERLATAQGGEHRTPAAPEASVADEAALSSLFEELRRAAAELRRAGGSAESGSLHHASLEGQGQPMDLEPMRSAARNSQDRERSKDARAEFRSAHLLWSCQDVLTAYGRPEDVQVHDGRQSWTYELPAPGGGTDHMSFGFCDGLVWAASYYYQESD